MKLTTFILMVALTQVSAASFAQKFTFSKKGASLEEVFTAIKKQTGYNVLYSPEKINDGEKLDVFFKDMQLLEVLEQLTKSRNYEFSIRGNNISIKPRATNYNFFANIDVRGRVTDVNGTPLDGATVAVKGEAVSTTTNSNGEFVLKNISDNATIQIKYVGYQTRELQATANLGSIQLAISTSELNAVDVTFNTGYQKIAKERSAGSFAKPDINVVLNRSTSTNILDRLEGLVPGLSSGRGGTGGVVIRGSTSINQSTLPLYVVDGIQMDLSNINAQDVEDITVLKDATAASIWGARAANGVIVITTKRGKAGDKLKVDYDGYFNFQGRPDPYYIPRISNAQHIALARELFPLFSVSTSWNALKTSLATGGSIPPHLQVLYDAQRRIITQAQADFKLDSLSKISNISQINDLFIRDASTLNHNISVSGGGKGHTFRGSFNHINNVSNTPGQRNNVYQLNLTNQFNIGKRIKTDIVASINNSVSRNQNVAIPNLANSYEYQLYKDANGNPITVNWAGTFIDSLRKDYQTRSRINLDYNPIMEQSRAYSTNSALNSSIRGTATIDLFKGLQFRGTYGYNYNTEIGRTIQTEDNYNYRVLRTRFTVAPTAASTPVYNLPQFGGTVETINTLTRGWTVRNQLEYNHDWKKHQLTAFFGQEATHQQGINSGSYLYGWDDLTQTSRPINAATLQNNTAGVAGTISGNALVLNPNAAEGVITRTTSYFSNAAYTFNRRYSVNASWRIDESNLFGFDKSAQNKPVYSFGAKWALGNEDFMKSIKSLNRLDVRLTYGITGNAPSPGQAASFNILRAIVDVNAVNGAGLVLATPANSKLTWERTQVYNAALDFAFFNNRLSGSVDLYLKKTSDLIGTLFTSPLTGYASVIGNFGDLQNKGIEVGLTSINIRGRDFLWSTSLSLGYNKNKLTKLNITPPTTGSSLVGLGTSTGTTRLIGQPLGLLHAYNYAGLNAAGDPQIRLANGTLSAAPNVSLPADILLMGITQAPFNSGLNNNFRYKSFDLNVNMIFNAGHVMRDPRINTTSSIVISGNSFQEGFLNRWKVPGDEARTDIPRYVNTNALAAARTIEYYEKSGTRVLSADYLKIRDVSLGYTLPQLVSKKINAQAITFRCNVNNLLLWTANDLNYDPEAIGVSRAAQGTVSLGAHITF